MQIFSHSLESNWGQRTVEVDVSFKSEGKLEQSHGCPRAEAVNQSSRAREGCDKKDSTSCRNQDRQKARSGS